MSRAARSALHLVGDAPRVRIDRRAFCGHCGATPSEAPAAANGSRVCAACGLGLVLETRADAAPSIADPFLVVDPTLAVCAVSRRAERLLGVSESEAVKRHLTELLVPARADRDAEHELVTALAWAPDDDRPVRRVAVRPANMFGVRFAARVTGCGPPRGSLIVLEGTSCGDGGA